MIFDVTVGSKHIGKYMLVVDEAEEAYLFDKEGHAVGTMKRTRLDFLQKDVMKLSGLAPEQDKYVYQEWFLRNKNPKRAMIDSILGED